MRSNLTMRNVLITLAACLLFACATPARGQGQDADNGTNAEAPVSNKTKTKKKKAAPDSATREPGEKRQRRFWLSASLSSVFDSNIEHDERRLRSFGMVPSLGFHFQDDAEKPSF